MSPDVQWLINIIVGLCGAFGAYVLKSVSAEQKEMQEAHARLAARIENLPNVYARRDDLKDSIERIEAVLDRIESKIDRKVDK